MARALPQGRPVHRRVLFGLLDGDGWAWASVKSAIWLLILIITLGYIPDRAYYFVVSRTIDLGLLGWSPVNLCPPENDGLPCPAPAGALVPWQPLPQSDSLPQPRAKGVAVQLGINLLYIGGTDGTAPSATTFAGKIEGGAFESWGDGPALPEARASAGIANLSGTAYLLGGTGPDGKPTDTVWSIGLNPDTSALGQWAVVEGVKLPAARSGASAAAVSDGIVVAGGTGSDGKPTATVWKASLSSQGKLGAFVEQPPLVHAITSGSLELVGNYLWLYGGSDEKGPSGGVQRAAFGSAGAAPAASGQPAASAAAAAASPAATAGPELVDQWATLDAANLPTARTGAAGFSANGVLYLVGGSDGQSEQVETYWAVPNANGDLPGGWRHLDQTDLPQGLADAAPVVTGSTVELIGGTSGGKTLASSVQAGLAPQEPFFRAGVAGVVVPGLQIGGEIGQQLGYLAAAGVGTGNFVILVIVGYLFNHKPQIRAWWERRRAKREAKAAT